jgi:RNA polymerase sigma factor (sigma-70 family)
MKIEEVAEFFEKNRRMLRSVCLNKCVLYGIPDPQYYADEAVQETFLRALRHIERRGEGFKEQTYLKPWLIAVAINAVRGVRKKNAFIFGENVLEKEDASSKVASRSYQLDDINYQELFSRLEGLLKPEEFAALLLSADGFDLIEIAKTLGLSKEYIVKNRLAAARQRIGTGESPKIVYSRRAHSSSPDISAKVIDEYRPGEITAIRLTPLQLLDLVYSPSVETRISVEEMFHRARLDLKIKQKDISPGNFTRLRDFERGEALGRDTARMVAAKLGLNNLMDQRRFVMAAAHETAMADEEIMSLVQSRPSSNCLKTLFNQTGLTLPALAKSLNTTVPTIRGWMVHDRIANQSIPVAAILAQYYIPESRRPEFEAAFNLTFVRSPR